MLVKILLISTWCGLMGIDMENFFTHLHRPLVSGLVVGFILGNVHVGLIAGATIEFTFMGLVPIAGAQPPNPVLAGILGSAFAIILGKDPKIIIGLIIPFTVLMSVLVVLAYTSYAFLANRATIAAEEENYSKMCRYPLYGLLGLFIIYFIMAFLPLYLGAPAAKALLDHLPKVILEALSIAGGAMPAIGFAIILTVMLRKSYIPYLAIGFVFVAYLHLGITAVAILAVCFACIDFYISKQIKEQCTKH